jgi:hypothetical protein
MNKTHTRNVWVYAYKCDHALAIQGLAEKERKKQRERERNE